MSPDQITDLFKILHSIDKSLDIIGMIVLVVASYRLQRWLFGREKS
jgi:hypothetical protein